MGYFHRFTKIWNGLIMWRNINANFVLQNQEAGSVDMWLRSPILIPADNTKDSKLRIYTSGIGQDMSVLVFAFRSG